MPTPDCTPGLALQEKQARDSSTAPVPGATPPTEAGAAHPPAGGSDRFALAAGGAAETADWHETGQNGARSHPLPFPGLSEGSMHSFTITDLHFVCPSPSEVTGQLPPTLSHLPEAPCPTASLRAPEARKQTADRARWKRQVCC